MGAAIRLLIKERSHLDKRRPCHRTRSRQTQAVFLVERVLKIQGREKLIGVQVAPHLHATVIIVFHPLTRAFHTYAQVHQQGLHRIIVGLDETGRVLIAFLMAAVDGNATVLHVLEVQVTVGVIDVGHIKRFHLFQVIIEARAGKIPRLVTQGRTEPQLVFIGKAVLRLYVTHPFVLVQLAEIAHGFLGIELEQIPSTVGHLPEHHLTTVGFLTGSLAIRTAPIRIPLAQHVVSGQLVILQFIHMAVLVTAFQADAFLVMPLTRHIAVHRITGIKGRKAHTVGLAERIAHTGQTGHLERLGKRIVIKTAHLRT